MDGKASEEFDTETFARIRDLLEETARLIDQAEASRRSVGLFPERYQQAWRRMEAERVRIFVGDRLAELERDLEMFARELWEEIDMVERLLVWDPVD